MDPLLKECFNDLIVSIDNYADKLDQINISAVVVAYRSNQILLECLRSLQTQSIPEFEVILVDNGGNEKVFGDLLSFNITHIRMKKNVGCSIGKNIGATFAQGDIVCFIDDDAIADQCVLEHNLNAYLRYPDIIGLRGKVLPKDPKKPYNFLATHYDLGDEIIPTYIDTETNTSFRRDDFLNIGGFSSPVMRGDVEGVELSYKISRQQNDPTVLIYYPKAVIYHDYASSIKKMIRKTLSQTRASIQTQKIIPDYFEYLSEYKLPKGNVQKPNGLLERIQVAFLRRLIRLTKRFSYYWYKITSRLIPI